MEAICKLQIDLISNICKAQTNFKKSPKTRLTEVYVESRLENLEKQWDTFNDNHSKIVTLSTSESKSCDYFKDDLYERTEELYLEYKAELKCILKRSKNVPVKSEETTKIKESNVKLPKISIPIFSGSYIEWTSFRDLFISLIHNNNSLDDVQKLHYLKSHLSGEAEQLLRHVAITAQNYQVCWTQLEKRYNNKRYLANCILKRFISQKNIIIESSSALKELLDTSNECLNALNNIGVDTQSWDIIIIYILGLKLDNESRKLWEVKLCDSNDELPNLNNFKEFLEQRFRSLEFMNVKSKQQLNVNNRNVNVNNLNVISVSCQFCSENHKLGNCKKFAQENVESRRNFVQSNRLCFNCFGANHSVYYCRQPTKCHICNKKHHSLLHPQGAISSIENTQRCNQTLMQDCDVDINNASSSNDVEASNIVSCFSNISGQVLLATALVKVESRNNYDIKLRALLDQGSQASFITESAVQLLGLKKVVSHNRVLGLGSDQHKSVTSRAVVYLKIQSLHDPSYILEVKVHVLNKLTSFIPEKKILVNNTWKHLIGIKLADPTFNVPNRVDLLLGAEVYGQIILEGLLKGPPGYPVAQNTKLGWILSGHVLSEVQENSEINKNKIVSMHVYKEANENDLLKKFWELESEPSSEKYLTEEEQNCEDIFAATTKRDESGRYIVKLPFRSEDPACKYNNSKDIALRRLKLLERKLERDTKLKRQYSEVIQEYLDLGHMEEVCEDKKDMIGTVYLPHHAVIREHKDTTKVRVVFDASCKGSNGVSLNNDLMIGPNLQSDLRNLIMRWRLHPICLVADIEKMYRQVKVCEEDIDFQRIFWRHGSSSEIKCYRLLRVTFGTASAPYLAVKVLQQIAVDEGKDLPMVSEKIINDFYMDDLLTGCQHIKEGKQIYKDINEILIKGGYKLQKWSSNSNELLKAIKGEEINKNESKSEENNLEIKMDEVMKILGLTWNRSTDEFEYVVNLPPLNYPVTKRKVISEIARLFDPLGWLAPTIIKAKIFIQKIWITGIDWDDQLPADLLQVWINFRDELNSLCNFRIPRWIGCTNEDVLELHGFCDASSDAYAAVIYMRIINKEGLVCVNLVTSKTKVSPIKQVTIPRLELCGASLLCGLLQRVAKTLNISKNNIHAWTDSSVVLAWLGSHPSRWKTFVANRVSEILTVMDCSQWSHVRSDQNPADCASRGVSPEKYNMSMWINGPTWLKHKTINYNRSRSLTTNLEIKKNKIQAFTNREGTEDENFLSKFSSLTKLIRIVAYCRRFLNLKNKNNTVKFSQWLTNKELQEALGVCIKYYQKKHFALEIDNLRNLGIINKKSQLTSFNPFLDSAGIIRVGGRLHRSFLKEEQKHPIIIPRRSHLTNLLIADAHFRTLHGGPQLMLNFLRSKYWILDAKNQIKLFVRRCVVCFRYSSKIKHQLMGQLPPARTTPCKPFQHSGVDYAGPIHIRSARGRGHHANKGYICLFICMVTRAIHLEAVSDLTTNSFLAAFKRFVARRGHCAHIWSDNATNFVGSSRELQQLFLLEKSGFPIEIADWLANNNTEWHFIPPHSPNFGGLWEAGIKSTKYHLKRVIGNSTLTFEEITTVLAQIEACLNSRPISQISDHPNDAYPLTPGHFLVGEPLVLVPDVSYEMSKISNLRRWQLTQKMTQEFWRRWSKEYLTQFLQRHKWSCQNPEPKIGDLVLVKEDNLPPAKWLYGIIIDKHPGLDKITRVVSLKCNGNIFKRPVSKICVLPIDP